MMKRMNSGPRSAVVTVAMLSLVLSLGCRVRDARELSPGGDGISNDENSEIDRGQVGGEIGGDSLNNDVTASDATDECAGCDVVMDDFGSETLASREILDLGAEAQGGDVSPAEDASGEDTLLDDCPKGGWVEIGGGEFMMGTDELDSSPRPEHVVRVDTFEMTVTEVTWCQYLSCVEDGQCDALDGFPSDVSIPVTGIDWQQARSYCQWTGGRLCTESEWEYAARNGPENSPYPWGNGPLSCELAVYADCYTEVQNPCTTENGNNKWGTCDLTGNVWEWVEDDWHVDYVGAPADGTAWVEFPREPERVFRGGAYNNYSAILSPTFRFHATTDGHLPSLGARCCRSPALDRLAR